MKNAVFWNVPPCSSCKNRRFGGRYRLYHLVERIIELGASAIPRHITEDNFISDYF
jgi:hypothetical protein